jgi:hypothetical protein
LQHNLIHAFHSRRDPDLKAEISRPCMAHLASRDVTKGSKATFRTMMSVVIGDSETVPVLVGLAVGIAFVVTLAMIPIPEIPHSVLGNDSDGNAIDCERYTDPATEPQECLNARVPDMTLNIAGQKYLGDKGSFCAPDVCVDTIFIVPEELIRVAKGSVIVFEAVGLRQPEMLGITIYKGENRSAPDDLQLPQSREKIWKFVVDLPSGDYILFVGANWMEVGYSEMDATYYYKIRVS